jgi:hypothetical protein
MHTVTLSGSLCAGDDRTATAKRHWGRGAASHLAANVDKQLGVVAVHIRVDKLPDLVRLALEPPLVHTDDLVKAICPSQSEPSKGTRVSCGGKWLTTSAQRRAFPGGGGQKKME